MDIQIIHCHFLHRTSIIDNTHQYLQSFMSNNLYTRINDIDRLKNFKQKLSFWDRRILNNFDLILTETELEIRGGNPNQQWKLFLARHKIQKIATSVLDVEVAIYGSVFSLNPNDRIGVFIPIDLD